MMSNANRALRYNRPPVEVIILSMEVKAQTAIDRLIEAVSPSLAAELDRIVQETRETMEQDFRARLSAAVQEAELARGATALAEIDRAVDEAKEETRRQVIAELEQEFGRKLDAATRQFRNEAAEERTRLETAMAQMKDEWSTELTKVDDERERWRTIAEMHQQLADASSQADILDRFLDLTQVFAPDMAVYVTKRDGLALWKSSGKTAFPKIISRETTDPESYFRLISIRGRTVAAVCAVPPFQAESVDFLASILERSIESFGLRLRAPLPRA